MARRRGSVGLFQFFFGQTTSDRARRDQYRPGTIGKNLISPINDYGTCFSCDGRGTRTLKCRPCSVRGEWTGVCRCCYGSGRLDRPEQKCFGCDGTGVFRDRACRCCGGTGVFKPAQSRTCPKCDGTGTYRRTCPKCNGSGDFTVTCRKCGGSGWYRF